MAEAAPSVPIRGGSSDVAGMECEIYNSASATGASDYADVFGYAAVVIQIVNGSANNFVTGVDTSLDGTNWQLDVAVRIDAGDAYAEGDVTVAGGVVRGLYLPTDDLFRFVRLNVTTANANGCVATVYAGR
jgi:hypothetical protein